MKNTLFIFILLLGILSLAQEKFNIWPEGKMSNSKGMNLEIMEEREGRITQIQTPEIYAFFPAKEERKPLSVLIIPGGGYKHLTYDLGGFQYAKWLNSLGISAFVLYYRLPTSPDLIQREIGPLQDAQMAMKFIRKNAENWGISPDKVGVLGTSAGGHLAAMLSDFEQDFTEQNEDWKSISVHPDFAVLISPVIDLGEFAHKGSRDNLLGENASTEKITEFSMQNHVSEKTPPTLLIHAQNDTAVPAENSILYYKEMLKNNTKGSLFIFPEGGHKIGIGNRSELTDLWKKLCSEWLEGI